MKHISSLFVFFINEICRNTLGGYVIVAKLKIGNKKVDSYIDTCGVFNSSRGERKGEEKVGRGVSELKLLKVFSSPSVHSALVVRRTTLFASFPIENTYFLFFFFLKHPSINVKRLHSILFPAFQKW